jgi:F-box-like
MDQPHFAPSHGSQFFMLPDEILLLILAVTPRGDQYSLMRVCRRLFNLAEPLLYKSVLLQDVQDSASFALSLAWHPER